MEADAAWSIDPLDEDRIPVVRDRDPSGHLGDVGQFLQQWMAEIAQREVTANDVAQPDQRCPEGVKRPWPGVSQVAELD
jgi:hypothetical protein